MNKVKYIIVLLILSSVFMAVYLLLPYGPNEMVATKYLSPSFEYVFGTDYLGRDLFSRVVHATLKSAITVVAAVVVATTAGFIYGSYAGYRGGIVKRMLVSGLNIFDSVPDFLLAIALLLLFATAPIVGSMAGLFIVTILVSWSPIARIVVNETQQQMSKGYIRYAIVNGARWPHIMKFHLAPVLKDNLVIIAIQKVPSLILISAFLGFIGVGFQPPEANLGKMISEGSLVFRTYPHILFFPMIFLIVLAQGFALSGYLLKRRKGRREQS